MIVRGGGWIGDTVWWVDACRGRRLVRTLEAKPCSHGADGPHAAATCGPANAGRPPAQSCGAAGRPAGLASAGPNLNLDGRPPRRSRREDLRGAPGPALRRENAVGPRASAHRPASGLRRMARSRRSGPRLPAARATPTPRAEAAVRCARRPPACAPASPAPRPRTLRGAGLGRVRRGARCARPPRPTGPGAAAGRAGPPRRL